MKEPLDVPHMSKFACITRLAYNIAVLIRTRLLKEKTLGGSWAIYQWYELNGNGENVLSACVLKELLYCVGTLLPTVIKVGDAF